MNMKNNSYFSCLALRSTLIAAINNGPVVDFLALFHSSLIPPKSPIPNQPGRQFIDSETTGDVIHRSGNPRRGFNQGPTQRNASGPPPCAGYFIPLDHDTLVGSGILIRPIPVSSWTTVGPLSFPSRDGPVQAQISESAPGPSTAPSCFLFHASPS
ncbi:unnamed protein product [Linum trigynum]|uniref:Uncharacterized protein n=1 Tax=Linum trigynum TaxID=586398 RepID=A0AAV2FEL3_9ROSI